MFAAALFRADHGPRVLEVSARDNRPSIKVDVELVHVPVTVTARSGKTITWLHIEPFQLSEDIVDKEIVSLTNQDAPASIGIVFDLSGSIAAKMVKARQAVHAFPETLNPEDEVMLVTFCGSPQLEIGS